MSDRSPNERWFGKKEEEDDDEEMEDEDEPGPSRGRAARQKRKVKKEFACHFCGVKFDDAGTCVRHKVSHLPPDERPEQTVERAVKSEMITKPSIEQKRAESRTHRSASQSMDALRMKIEVELSRKPTLLYFDVPALDEHWITHFVSFYKATPECEVLVLRVREVPLDTKYELKRPTAIVPSTRSPTHFVFYCKKEHAQLADQIKDALPACLSFCQLAGDLIPALLLSSALLVPVAERRATVDVDALALLHVFVV